MPLEQVEEPSPSKKASEARVITKTVIKEDGSYGTEIVRQEPAALKAA